MSGAAAQPVFGDDATRRRALDQATSFLVQAPAGSGKTELLIQRFLALLARVPEPEAIVAITFTRKAAGEMQDRILGALARAARNEMPAKPHERTSHELALDALQQDRRQGWGLLAHPSRLRIQTIDSLCASITRQMPWLACLGSQPAVTEDADPHYLEAARRTLAMIEQEGAWREPLETVLAHLDNSVPHTAKLIVQMLRFRDHWLHLTVEGAASREELERAMENAVNDGLALASELFPEPLRNLTVELAGFAAGNVPEAHPLKPCAGLTAWPQPLAAQRALWDGLCALLLTSEGDAFRKEPTTGFPGFSKEKVAAVRKLYRDRKEQARGLYQALQGRFGLLEALARVKVLPPARYADSQWQVMESLLRVLKLAAANLRLVFRESGEVDFPEIAESARTALGDAAEPTELALGLDARIRHLLVDEFQDTSVSQFELLEKLTAGWEPGDGRTIFLVGDPMQSIYRFRQAEVGLFLKVAEGAAGPISPEFLRLNANHRSQAGIVNWVNEAFRRIFPQAGDVATGAITYSQSEPRNPEEPGEAVTLHALRKGEDAAEAALVVQLVQEARAADPAGRIAILVRARSHLAAIVPALKDAGLPFRAIEIDRLSERSVVRDMLALTRAMLHFADRTAWLAILRAPWCGLELRDLYALVDSRPDAVVWDLLTEDRPGLSPNGAARILRLRSVLSRALAERGRTALRRWVERTWWALGGPSCTGSEDALQDAADYLDLLEKHERAGDLPDFDGFREQVDQLYARPDPRADGTLEVMTIHKAKGLQFETVIVPGLGRVPRPDSASLLLSAERPRREGVDRLLASIQETGGGQDPVYEYLRDVERLKAANENIRLLYVACTRAVGRLHLIGNAVEDASGKVNPQSGSLLDRLWSGLSEVEKQLFAERYATSAGQAAGAQPEGVPLSRLTVDWAPPKAPAPLPLRPAAPIRDEQRSYLWVGDTLRHVGTVVHGTLQAIGQEGLAAWDQARVRANRDAHRVALANLGTPPQELDRAVARVEQALLRTLSSPCGRWILTSRPGARCEYAMAGLLAGEIVHVSVDRTFVDGDGVRWIVDYKTSDHQGGRLDFFLDEEQRRYRDQLERYARFLAPSGAVKLGLYFPLLDGWREWQPARDEGGQS
jgi:ATP-dependent helicase/nuclease subunit A